MAATAGSHTVLESKRSTIARRVKTVPAMLGATALAFWGFPVLVLVAVGYDLVRGRVKLPTVRLYLFVLHYLFNDTVEILLWPLYPLVPGLAGRTMNWSVKGLAVSAEWLLGISVNLDLAGMDPEGGPVIILSRHVSVLDASIPGLVCHEAGLNAKGVIMAELLADPGFDIVYGRMGSVFIPRDNAPEALELVAQMTADAGSTDAYVLFPEGRLFRPEVRDKLLARLAESSPDRAERLAGLVSSLPPRPGGVLALLASAPGADVVVIEHSGLERFGRFADIAAGAPLGLTVQVSTRRIPRHTIPDDPSDATRWLDEVWLDLDSSARDSIAA